MSYWESASRNAPWEREVGVTIGGLVGAGRLPGPMGVRGVGASARRRRTVARAAGRTGLVAAMLLFCPGCGNGLIVEEGQRCHRFACNTCPYVHNVTRKVGPGRPRGAHSAEADPNLPRPSSAQISRPAGPLPATPASPRRSRPERALLL